MKIAVIKKVYDPEGGGAERYTATVCRKLLERGHELTVFSESFKSAGGSGALNHVDVPRSFFAPLGRTYSFHKNLRRTIAGRSFDIVYSIARTWPSDVFRVSEQVHIEWMKMRYSPWQKFNPRHAALLELERKIFTPGNTRAVVVNSLLAKRQIIANYGYPEDRIHHVRNGVDRDIFSPARDAAEKGETREKLAIPPGKTVFLLPAAMNFGIKGVDSAIRAVAELAKDAAGEQLLIVTGGDTPSPFMALAENLGVKDRIRFDGPRKDMRSYYIASDILLFPSIYEPFANVCLEACACGLPVITTSMNGSSELIAHGGNGYVISNSTNIGALADAARKFCSLSAAEKEAFAKAAVAASAPYDWDTHADALECLFKTMANQ